MMKIWKNAGIDALIAPGIPPAHKFHLTDKVAVHMIYAYIWNVFNLPAGVIPVTSILENVSIMKIELIKKMFQSLL